MKLKKAISKAAKAVKPAKKPTKKISTITKKAAKKLKPKSKSSSVNIGSLGKKIGGAFSKTFKSIGKAISKVFSPQVKGSKAQCPKNLILTEVGFISSLKGKDSVLKKEGMQFVNLPSGIVGGITPTLNMKQKHWVDGKFVTELDRLGSTVRVRAKINKPVAKVHIFYRLVPDSENAKYSNGKPDKSKNELHRNENFKHDLHNSRRSIPTWKIMRTNDQGVATGSLIVSQAGKNKYHVEAILPKANRAKGTGQKPTKSANAIVTNRLVYITPQKMDGLKAPHPKIDNKEVVDNFKEGKSGKTAVQLVLLPKATTSIDYLANIDDDKDKKSLLGNSKDAFEDSVASNKSPYCIIATFVDQIAREWTKGGFTIRKVATAGEENNSFSIQTVSARPGGAAVTRQILPVEDWFKGGEFIYDDNQKGKRNILKSMVTSVQDPTENKVTNLNIDLSSLDPGDGKVRLKLRLVDYWVNGVAYGDSRHLVLATRTRWTPRELDAQVQTIIHEIGHKFQMAANGGYALDSFALDVNEDALKRREQHLKAPDVILTHYDDSKGHRGNHCYNGLSEGRDSYANADESETILCVMYGESHHSRPSHFCEHCEVALRKVDLSNGWN